jgi:hypothetical protein
MWLLWATGLDGFWLRDVTPAVWQKLHTLPNSLVVADIKLFRGRAAALRGSGLKTSNRLDFLRYRQRKNLRSIFER